MAKFQNPPYSKHFKRHQTKQVAQLITELFEQEENACDNHFLLFTGHQFPQVIFFNPLPDDKILDWSKLKQIADDILK